MESGGDGEVRKDAVNGVDWQEERKHGMVKGQKSTSFEQLDYPDGQEGVKKADENSDGGSEFIEFDDPNQDLHVNHLANVRDQMKLSQNDT